MNTTKEIWKLIEDFEDRYEISNYGRVVSLKRNRKLVSHTIKNNQDSYVRLIIKQKATIKVIKDLVAHHFLKNDLNYKYVYQIDGDLRNNKVDNLAYTYLGTRSNIFNIGDKLKYLEIISYNGLIRRRDTYKCKCICGNIQNFTSKRLKNEKNLSCGCVIYIKKGAKDPKLFTLNNLYSIYKRSAKNHNREFKLTLAECVKLFTSSCKYCGDIPSRLVNAKKYNFKKHKSFKTKEYINTYNVYVNGIDRINSLKGYSFDNCVSCCEMCNRIKLDYTKEEFYDKIIKIYKNLNLNEKKTNI